MANTTRGMPKDECAFGIRHDSYPLNTKSVFSVDLAMNCATTNKNICRVSLRSTHRRQLSEKIPSHLVGRGLCAPPYNLTITHKSKFLLLIINST